MSLTPHAIRVLPTLVGALVPLALLAAPAAASPGPGGADPAPSAAGGWQRYHAEPFRSPAGELCPFPLRSQVLLDREYVRTTAQFPDGSPRTQQFVGPLVVRLTNERTGRSVRRDLSARAVVRYATDGSFDFSLQGPAAVGFHPGDGLPTGYYVLRGAHTVHFTASGARTLTVDRGSEEDVCSTLA